MSIEAKLQKIEPNRTPPKNPVFRGGSTALNRDNLGTVLNGIESKWIPIKLQFLSLFRDPINSVFLSI